MRNRIGDGVASFGTKVEQTSSIEASMFPETDRISNIISDTIKVVFQRRLVGRVLRLWKEMADRERFHVATKSNPLSWAWMGKLPRHRGEIACPAFNLRMRWRKSVFYALPRRKPRRSSRFTFAAGFFRNAVA